jgi:hypothetical protein
MLLGIFIVAAVLLSPFLGIFIVAAHVSFIGKPQQHISIARLWRAPAREIEAAQLVHVVDQQAADFTDTSAPKFPRPPVITPCDNGPAWSYHKL